MEPKVEREHVIHSSPVVGCSSQILIRRRSRSFCGTGETSAMHSAQRVMWTLCSPRGRIFPSAMAWFSGALVLLLNCVDCVLQVLAFQFYDFPYACSWWK